MPFSMTARRSLALFAAFAAVLALALGNMTSAVAQDEEPPAPQALDLDADDNIATAIDWSTLAFPEGADEVLIGRADLFADNLSSGGAQGATAALANGRPLLLTGSNSLDQRVVDELARLAPTSVIILGGEAAISLTVEQALSDLGYTVNRLEGASRIETAIEVARTLESDTAVLVRAFPGENGDDTQAFADTVTAAAWAAENGWPILFTQTEVLTGSTRDYLGEAGFTQLYIVGGEAAISAEVEEEAATLVETVTRIAGDTRFATAIAIANERGLTDHTTAGLSVLVDGQGADAWADGFSAAAFAGNGGYPVVLANSATAGLPQETADFLGGGAGAGAAAFAQDAPTYVLICGPSAPDSQCNEAGTLLGAEVVKETPPVEEPVNNQSIEVLPTEEGVIQDDEERDFTVTEPAEGIEYTIALIPAENVSVDEDGVVTFVATAQDEAAGLGETSATITKVNGVDVTTAGDMQTATGSPELTFSVGGDVFEEVIPVVFVDENENEALDLDADGLPLETEPFGIGGFTRILPPAANNSNGTPEDSTIVFVDAEENMFATDAATYTVEDTDMLKMVDPDTLDTASPLTCTPAADMPIADFLARLTVGDQVDGTSTANSTTGMDTICVEDISPVAPVLAVETDATTDDAITVTLTGIHDGAEVTIYDADEPASGDPVANPDTDDDLTTATEDADPATDGFQVLVDGLEPATEYRLYATQTLGSQTSEPSNIETETTKGSIAIVSVAPSGDVNDGSGSTNKITVQFSEPVTLTNRTKITVTDETGARTYTVAADSDVAGSGTATWTITLSGNPNGNLTDAPVDITYTLNVGADAMTAVSGGASNPAMTATFEY